MYKINLNKSRSTWLYSVSNPFGGSSGSSYCGPQYIALAYALALMPVGADYELIVNGKSKGFFTKTEEV